MQTDLSRRHWLGMAAVCAISMAAGIARTRLAQGTTKPEIRNTTPENREKDHDRVSTPTASRPGVGAPR